MKLPFCDHCRRPNTFPYPFNETLCISCINALSDDIGGVELDRLLGTLPADDLAVCKQIAKAFARRNSCLPDMAQPTTSQDYEVSPTHDAVDQRRRQWRAHYDWLKAFTHVPPSTAYAGLVLVAIEMQKLFHDYLAQPQAPQSWVALKRVAPGSFETWLVYTDAYQACALALASPETRGKDDSARMVDAINGMLRAMVSTPVLLCGANMNLGSWNAKELMAGWSVANISIRYKWNPRKANRRLGNEIEAYREHLRAQPNREPMASYSVYHIMCELMPDVAKRVWDRADWQTLKKLRTAMARELEKALARQNKDYEQEPHLVDPVVYENTTPDPDNLFHRFELDDLLSALMKEAGLSSYQEDILRISILGDDDEGIAKKLHRSPQAIEKARRDAQAKMARKHTREYILSLINQ